jgi:hypothetical protein
MNENLLVEERAQMRLNGRFRAGYWAPAALSKAIIFISRAK